MVPALLCVLTLLAGLAPVARADTLRFPAVVSRTGPAVAQWQIDQPLLSSEARLSIRWTDGAGRLVDAQDIMVAAGTIMVPVTIDTRRAVTRFNTLSGQLSSPNGSVRTARMTFIARPSAPEGLAGWSDFQVIMWQEGPPAREAELRRLGFTAGKVTADRDGTGAAATAARLDTVLGADLGLYVENIATDFYAAYHRWTPGKPVTWLYDETRKRHAADPTDPAGYLRTPSLSDPAWRSRIATRLAEHVARFSPYKPLYYNLGDETGIADLAAFWDFDLSPESLAGFRTWLQSSYASLAALNEEWGTAYSTWAEVMPMLTDAALQRRDDNFAAWSDFKDWMDEAFADALRHGTQAVHAADPNALAAIEGAQVPGWGGYDYARLANALDVIEGSNGGHSLEIARSINPSLVTLSTCFGQGPAQHRLIWRRLLLGNRGVVVWDSAGKVISRTGEPGPRGRDLAPLFIELRNGIAAQLIAANDIEDPVGILVSPASFRVNWLLERRRDGVRWEQWDSETQYEHPTADGRSLNLALERLTGLGIRPRFLTPSMLSGDIAGLRILILPRTIALSDQEAGAIRSFIAAGGKVLADGEIGLFDGHGKRRVAPALSGLTVDRPASLDTTSAAPADPADRDALAGLAGVLRAAGIDIGMAMLGPDARPAGGVELRRRQTGAISIVSVIGAEDRARDRARDRAADAAPGEVTLSLASPVWMTDLRRGGEPVFGDRFPIVVPADGPAIVALSPRPPNPPIVDGPRSARAGEVVPFLIGIAPPPSDGAPDGASHVVHVEVRDPDGKVRDNLASNMTLGTGPSPWLLRLAMDDPPGRWVVRVTDRLGGGTAEATLDVQAVPIP